MLTKAACLLLLGSLMLSGCARNYVVRLTNGRQIVATTKPKRQGNVYVFKDGQGRDASVVAGSVSEILPASMAEDRQQSFSPTPPQ